MKRDRGSQQPSILSFFTSAAAKQKPDSADPPSKKQRQLPAEEDDNSVIVLDGADELESGGAVDAAAVQQQQAAPAPVEQRVLPTERDAAAHGVAQAKLVASRTWDEPAGQPQQLQQQQAPARSSAARQGQPKYTPLVGALLLASCVTHCYSPPAGHTRHPCVLPWCLCHIACLPALRWLRCCVLQEQQVLSLQAAHPGVLLLVEVGYKMRMFGQDAEVAAKVMQLTAFGA